MGFPHTHRYDRMAEAEPDGHFVHVYNVCHEQEIVSEMTDPARDETYTETGQTCQTQRTKTYTVEPVNDLPDHIGIGEVTSLISRVVEWETVEESTSHEVSIDGHMIDVSIELEDEMVIEDYI